jgi:pantetheine-phosphate adenylyltransferase
MSKIAIYPGTFDPLTNGHLDIVCRSLCVFDNVIIAIAPSVKKNPLFTLDERLAMIQQSIEKMERVQVEAMEYLLADFFREKQGVAVIRGLRAVSDFEYELQMALINKRLNPYLETVFMMPSEENTFLTSSAVREIAYFGGDVSQFVPPLVSHAINAKLKLKMML